MWKFTSEAPNGMRFKKDVFMGVTCYPARDGGRSVWFNPRTSTFDEYKNICGSKSSHGMKSIKSLKAFKRYVIKHCQHLKDQEIVLCSNYFFDNGDVSFSYSWTARYEGIR